MAALEREYNVPLRKEWLKVPRYKRAKKATKALREFLARHMKTDIKNVKIGKWLNIALWKRGIKKPPHHIKVKAIKDDKGIVNADLSLLPKEAIEERKKEEEAKGKKLEEKAKTAEKPAEEKKEEKKAEEGKKEEKEETAEEKEEEEKKEKDKVLQKQIPKAKKAMAQQKGAMVKRKALEK